MHIHSGNDGRFRFYVFSFLNQCVNRFWINTHIRTGGAIALWLFRHCLRVEQSRFFGEKLDREPFQLSSFAEKIQNQIANQMKISFHPKTVTIHLEKWCLYVEVRFHISNLKKNIISHWYFSLFLVLFCAYIRIPNRTFE